jgi:hypothetical protein
MIILTSGVLPIFFPPLLATAQTIIAGQSRFIAWTGCLNTRLLFSGLKSKTEKRLKEAVNLRPL